MLGTYVLSSGYYDAYYKRALQVRRLIKEEFDRAFNECDILLGPTAPTPAFGIGEDMDPIQMYLCDVYTVNTNISGHCGVSLQGGFADSGAGPLPVGLHLQAPPRQLLPVDLDRDTAPCAAAEFRPAYVEAERGGGSGPGVAV